MSQQTRQGRYSIATQELLFDLKADSVAVSVINGRHGHGCSVATQASIEEDPELLRKHGQALLIIAQSMIAQADLKAGRLRPS